MVNHAARRRERFAADAGANDFDADAAARELRWQLGQLEELIIDLTCRLRSLEANNNYMASELWWWRSWYARWRPTLHDMAWTAGWDPDARPHGRRHRGGGGGGGHSAHG